MPVPTPLTAILAARGGVPGPTTGARFLHFGDPLHEVSGSRRKAGFFEHIARREITVLGTHAMKAVQGQVTQDLRGLAPGQGAYAAFLDRKGRLMSDAVVLVEAADRLRLLVPESRRDWVRDRMAPVAMLEDCELVLPEVDPARILLSGPLAFDVLADQAGAATAPIPYEHFARDFGGHPARVIGWPETGDRAALVELDFAHADAVGEAILTHADVLPAGDEAFQALRIEAGVPAWERELTEGRLPPECGIPEAISYTKGCYVGQETIARIRTYGQVNRRLVAILGDATLRAGASLVVDDKEVGVVTSALPFSDFGHPIALGFVRRGSDAPGSRLTAKFAGHESEVAVQEAPLRARLYSAAPRP